MFCYIKYSSDVINDYNQRANIRSDLLHRRLTFMQPYYADRNSALPLTEKLVSECVTEMLGELQAPCLVPFDKGTPRTQTSNMHIGVKEPIKIPKISKTHSLSKLNTTLMINPDCYVQILLDYICNELKINRSAKVELCTENGELLNLTQLKAHESAKLKMENRKVYYLIALIGAKAHETIGVAPLFYGSEESEINLIAYLRGRYSHVYSKVASRRVPQSFSARHSVQF